MAGEPGAGCGAGRLARQRRQDVHFGRKSDMLQQDDLRRDLRAVRRHAWFPVVAILVALAAAAVLGLARGSGDRAEFRLRVIPAALPPLFGPPTLPGPADFASFAISQPVTDALSQKLHDQGVAGADSLAGRLSAAPRPNQPAVEFTVRGENALAVARAWRDSFTEVLPVSLPEIERAVTADYAHQLDHARNELMSRQADAASGETGADLALAAARANLQTAEQLSQSYEIVGQTMRVDIAAEQSPHLAGSSALDWAARLGAALAFGLVAGLLGALGLEQVRRRTTPLEPQTSPVYETTSPPS